MHISCRLQLHSYSCPKPGSMSLTEVEGSRAQLANTEVRPRSLHGRQGVKSLGPADGNTPCFATDRFSSINLSSSQLTEQGGQAAGMTVHAAVKHCSG